MGSRGAFGAGARRAWPPAADTGMACDVRGWNTISSAYAPTAPRAALAPIPSTARRLKSGMRAIMPSGRETFGWDRSCCDERLREERKALGERPV